MNSNVFTKNGKYLMLAFDHRGSFEKFTEKKYSKKEDLIEIKKQIIISLKNKFSGILIDQEYGLPAYKTISGLNKPFLLPAEESGYDTSTGERITKIKYNADLIKNSGASGVKLLIYFNPNHSSHKKQLETAKKVMENAKQNEMPFFLEIVHYDMEPTVCQTVQTFLDFGIKPDVFKLEFPGNEEECKKVSDILGDVPWILLTKGVSFEEFCNQLEISKKGNCAGFLAGRALWQDFFDISDTDGIFNFLTETLPNRFEVLEKIME